MKGLVVVVLVVVILALGYPADAISRRHMVKRRQKLRVHKKQEAKSYESAVNDLLEEARKEVADGEEGEPEAVAEESGDVNIDETIVEKVEDEKPKEGKKKDSDEEDKDFDDGSFADAMKKLASVIKSAKEGETEQVNVEGEIEETSPLHSTKTLGQKVVGQKVAGKKFSKNEMLGKMLQGFPVIPPFAKPPKPTTAAPAAGGEAAGGEAAGGEAVDILQQVKDAIAAAAKIAPPPNANSGTENGESTVIGQMPEASGSASGSATGTVVGQMPAASGEANAASGEANATVGSSLADAIAAQKLQLAQEMLRENAILKAESDASIKLQKVTAVAAAKALQDNITATKADMVASAAKAMANSSHLEAEKAINLLKSVHGAKLAKQKMTAAAETKMKAQRELEIAKAAIVRHEANLNQAKSASESLDTQVKASSEALDAASADFNTNSNRSISAVLAQAQANNHAENLALASQSGIPVQPHKRGVAVSGSDTAPPVVPGVAPLPTPGIPTPPSAAQIPGMQQLYKMFSMMMANGGAAAPAPAVPAAAAAPAARRRFFFF